MFIQPQKVFKCLSVVGSLGDTILNSLQEFAASVVDTTSATGYRDDVTFIPSQSSHVVGNFPGYKPVTVPAVFVDCETAERPESLKTKTPQSRYQTSRGR